jgi:hypothetical protein
MKIRYLIFLLLTALQAGSVAGQSELPAIKGGWWKIAESEPDVSPWNNPGVHNACDFTIWQDETGTWHLVACIRETTFPGSTRLFHHWTSPGLTQTNWTPAAHTNTFGTETVTNGIFAVSNPNIGQYPGVMQAPHCIKDNGKYYFFYNGAYTNASGARQNNSAYCKISDDGVNFTDTTNTAGSYKFFDMGRDISLMQTTNGTWNSYFEKDGLMSARTAPALQGPWSTNIYLLGTTGNPESPFVVRRGSEYFLWEQMKVYYSTNPLRFTNSLVAELDSAQYAPEVFEYNGQYYMGSYDSGIFLTRLDWMSTTASQADLTNMTVTALSYGSELIPRFNYYSTEYLIVEKYAKSSLTFTNTLRNPAAQLTMSVTNANGLSAITVITNASGQRVGVSSLAVGENIIKISVTSGADTKTYKIHVTRKDAAGLDTAAAPILPASGLFIPGSAVTLDSLSSLAEIRYTLDGSVPTTNSLLYAGPVTLTSNVALRAVAFLSGQNSSIAVQQAMEAVYPSVVYEYALIGDAPVLRWNSQTGCQYRLETTTNLLSGWTEAAVLNGTGSSINYTSPPVADTIFYRVKTTF